MRKNTKTAHLKCEAKRFYSYTYGNENAENGSFTIGKNLLKAENIDFIGALRSGDITVENVPDARLINLDGSMVDEAALSLISAVLDAYSDSGKMPETVRA